MTYARFAVTTPSRHPGNVKGYDNDRHCYRPDYVNPTGWTLYLLFLPQGIKVGASGKLELPKEIDTFRWSIHATAGDFDKGFTLTHSNDNVSTAVSVPRPGEYLITVKVTLRDGRTETSSRPFVLRDHLIVGIGDSFASGQGNPDAPAVAAADQQLMCKMTSVTLVAAKVAEAVQELQREIASGIDDAILYLPYAGKLVVGYLNGARGLAHYVDNEIEDLGDLVVEIGRDAVSYVEEGLEEIVDFFGGGSGGGHVHPHPAVWQEPYAYRSYRAAQSIAARQIESSTPYGAHRTTFIGLGRTGSSVDDGILGPRTTDLIAGGERPIDGWTRNRGQIQEAKDTAAGRHIDAVMVSIGINDLGFSSLVSKSILKASGQKRRDRIRGAQHTIDAVLPGMLDRLQTAIARDLNPDHVLITEYPVEIFEEIALGAEPCGVLGSTIPSPVTLKGLDLDRSDAIDLGELGRSLNALLKSKAEEFGWVYVGGVVQAFHRHGYCSRRTYFVSAEESCLNQGDFEGMLHPNAAGHKAAANALARALNELVTHPRQRWLEPVLAVLMS